MDKSANDRECENRRRLEGIKKQLKDELSKRTDLYKQIQSTTLRINRLQVIAETIAKEIPGETVKPLSRKRWFKTNSLEQRIEMIVVECPNGIRAHEIQAVLSPKKTIPVIRATLSLLYGKNRIKRISRGLYGPTENHTRDEE